MLKSAKVPEQNVTKEERQAIKTLKKNKDIMILPADKGKSTVVMDTMDYEEKVINMLADKTKKLMRSYRMTRRRGTNVSWSTSLRN